MQLRGLPHRAVLAVVLLLCAAVSLGAQTAANRSVQITLLQVNDVYQISPVDKGARGGLARVATLRKSILKESPHTLLLLAGDTISPSVASNIFKGRQMIAAWNATGLDYAVLGNHEFDFGDEVLLERIKESGFTWLAANVIDKKTGKPFPGTKRYVIREFGGVKVGLLGLVTPDTKKTSKPGPDVEFLDPLKTAARLVPQMRARGAAVIVAVTHLTLGEDKKLARAATIDVIIGGHEHSVLQSLSGCTPIFKMGSDARNLGRIELSVSPTGKLLSIDWEVISVTNSVADDPQTAAAVNEYETKLAAELDLPVGRTRVALDARQETNRSRETNLGSFIADAHRAALHADVALVNGGSIRSNTSYGPGVLSKRDVLSILPFENPIVKVEVTGAVLRAALEHGVATIAEEQEAGRFPQVSGLRFAYDARRAVGSRLTAVSVGGQPLDDSKTYTLAINSFVLGGGDGYAMFRAAHVLVKPEEGPVEPAVVIAALAAAGEIAPETDGRIKRVDAPRP
ncbi:MAG: bifunctional metallophosphatase/5'-nucleotidase [Acidobacteria bacterium]|nr:bifunctional metallophosphatase/5'-nucleotidase [Acidobacteriota bacterium]